MKSRTKIQTIIESSSGGVIVDIECHISNSLPNIVIVGFANRSVDEAKERIRGALASSNIQLPKKRITVNLAPADLPKEGSYFDLPITLGILTESGIISAAPLQATACFGEIGLDGTIRPVRGIIGKILNAQKLGFKKFLIPEDNCDQARLIPGLHIEAAHSIRELVAGLNDQSSLMSIETGDGQYPSRPNSSESTAVSIDDVVGQQHAKRALLIAAAGHHNIMLNGPPGAGKSMLASTITSILPPLTLTEILETTHIHSLASRNYDQIIHTRPVRSPHHSASAIAVIGGGQNPRPGEISLSHNGVLVFDEFPEFNRQVIEALRQPLEDKVISVARAKDTARYPADFLLIATANPCPCGFFGTNRECSCLPYQITNYQRKISGPIIDRIDLYVDVEEVEHASILRKQTSNQREQLALQVKKARQSQLERSSKLNSRLSGKDFRSSELLSSEAKDYLDSASGPLGLSARSYIRILRIARTIADLEEEKLITSQHIAEALQYRKRSATV